ncbi:hypothetical protein F4820DRAFT_211992 [Hypoxylon rubiginosum]|uniref:Uncharacterized protein n=1 Tax=Hypoxylon rubiginosum TaxID=110542 RepID=A0ACB9YI22_9PEZI|nr:hypothetical protein F4820DRAFT_211992 [Hypoxylon rubiginosum]
MRTRSHDSLASEGKNRRRRAKEEKNGCVDVVGLRASGRYAKKFSSLPPSTHNTTMLPLGAAAAAEKERQIMSRRTQRRSHKSPFGWLLRFPSRYAYSDGILPSSHNTHLPVSKRGWWPPPAHQCVCGVVCVCVYAACRAATQPHAEKGLRRLSPPERRIVQLHKSHARHPAGKIRDKKHTSGAIAYLGMYPFTGTGLFGLG